MFCGGPRASLGDWRNQWKRRTSRRYAVGLLAKFYPLMSGMFSPDVSYKDGQIDALLDFGSFVLVIEIKASLLTEPAKRSADKETFFKGFRRKFVENEKGNPKAIKQLASACRAILKGEIPVANRNESPVIYPIFISDEPTIETTFMNALFYDEFQKEGIDDPKVKPLTIMAIDELEQLLSHFNDGDFTWEELPGRDSTATLCWPAPWDRRSTTCWLRRV
jgi:hypothetical protein